MGKYIIEVGDAYAEYICGKGDMLCLPVRINEFEDNWLNTNIPLTPYTEPDTDEAYRRGYETAKHECEDCRKIRADAEQELADKIYQKGLNDAWEAARKIANMPYDEEEKAFGSAGWTFIEKHTAAEAIEKIKAYEQEQEEIQVGDEVTDDKGDTGVCTEISYPANSMHIMYADGTATDISLTGVTQTGRHFPEIVAVLQKMKEES